MSYNLAQISIASNITYKVPVVSTVPSAVSWVCLTNKSPFLLSVYVGMHSFYVPAWYYWPIQIDPLNGVTLPISFLTIGDAGLASPPSSWYSATVYEYGEKPPPGLDIPQSIPGQVSIASGSVGVAAGATIAVSGPIAVSGITTPVVLDSGSIPPTTVGISGTVPISGSVGITAGQSVNIAAGTNPVTVSGAVSVIGQGVSIDNTLINDGTIASTIIESTVYSSADSNVVVKNDGTWNIVEYVSSVLTALFRIIPGTGLKLGSASPARSVEVVGNLLVDGNATVTTGSQALGAYSGATFGATTMTSGNFTCSGALTGSSLVTTSTVGASKANFTTGGISRISTGQLVNVAPSSATAFNHSLGTTPDIVLLTLSKTGCAATALSVTNLTSTQFTINNNSPSCTTNAYFVAFKF